MRIPRLHRRITRGDLPFHRCDPSTTKELNMHGLAIGHDTSFFWRKMIFAASLFRCSIAILCFSASRLYAASALWSRILRACLARLYASCSFRFICRADSRKSSAVSSSDNTVMVTSGSITIEGSGASLCTTSGCGSPEEED